MRRLPDAGYGAGGKRRFPPARLHPAIPYVRLDFRFRKRRNRQTYGNSLLELPQVLAVEQAVEFALPHQHNLEQLVVGGFEVPEQADLLQHFQTQLVGFVDDQRGDLVFPVSSPQEALQDSNTLRLAGGNVRQPKIQ